MAAHFKRTCTKSNLAINNTQSDVTENSTEVSLTNTYLPACWKEIANLHTLVFQLIAKKWNNLSFSSNKYDDTRFSAPLTV